MRIRFLFLMFCLMLISIGSLKCLSQDTVKSLDLQRSVNFRLVDADSDLFLRVLSRRFSVPIGFYKAIRIDKRQERKTITINANSKSLKWILDEFVKQDSRYEWVLDNGVINVMPKSRDELLDIYIDAIKLENINLDEAAVLILKISKVSAFLKKHGLKAGPVTFTYGSKPQYPAFSIELANTTLENFLNQMLRNKACGYWVIERLDEDNTIIGLRFE